ncbi:MAG TPA: acetylxylan esterase, partial [Lacipirellulaceae bacterium]|nr:acetylxylan esterase [Lacipirellulaceae bacterium]
MRLATSLLTLLSMLVGPTYIVEAADTNRGDEMLAAYFRDETQHLADASLANIKSADDWNQHRDEYRQQLAEMLGLDPLPERTPLQAVVTGKLDREDFSVEKLYFQSRPHLYVTANLYLPKNAKGPSPAILYACGHATIKEDGISYGSKAAYQKQPAWFARNGYVCLVMDTLQLGEIEGIHHGTYREGMWWWNARGYTPAGVETWNAMRAIDYLSSRPEVDATRIGMAGHSGGGASTWYVTAMDDRIKAAVPMAGITTLKNHIVDGCVAHHCDCMYFVNTYRWDFPQLAALATPRPLLISNTDRDTLFPLDGVLDIHAKVRHLYELAGHRPDIALEISSGPHAETQVLRLHTLEWFNQHFKGEDPLVETAAKDFFNPEELKVFDKLPDDQINTRIHETFVPVAPTPAQPKSKQEWQAQRDRWMTALREKCFHGWPADIANQSPELVPAINAVAGDVKFSAYDFKSQANVPLRLYVLQPDKTPMDKLDSITLCVLNASDWHDFISAMRVKFDIRLSDETLSKPDKASCARLQHVLASNQGLAFVAPRGIGTTRWTADPTAQIHIRRRFMLLGQTLDAMRVWDVRRAIQALHTIDGAKDLPLSLSGEREMAGIALYAALFEPKIKALTLTNLSKSHRDGPDFINVLKYLDIPQAVAMTA